MHLAIKFVHPMELTATKSGLERFYPFRFSYLGVAFVSFQFVKPKRNLLDKMRLMRLHAADAAVQRAGKQRAGNLRTTLSHCWLTATNAK